MCTLTLCTFAFTVFCAFQESEHVKADGSKWKPFEIEDVPDDNGYTFEMVDGVFQVIGCKRNLSGEPNTKRKPIVHPYPSIDEFMEDQNVLLALSTHGPVYVPFMCLMLKVATVILYFSIANI